MKTKDLIALLMGCLTVVAVVLIVARCSVEQADNCRASGGTPIGLEGCAARRNG